MPSICGKQRFRPQLSKRVFIIPSRWSLQLNLDEVALGRRPRPDLVTLRNLTRQETY